MRFIITYMYYVPVPSTLLEGSALKATVLRKAEENYHCFQIYYCTNIVDVPKVQFQLHRK